MEGTPKKQKLVQVWDALKETTAGLSLRITGAGKEPLPATKVTRFSQAVYCQFLCAEPFVITLPVELEVLWNGQVVGKSLVRTQREHDGWFVFATQAADMKLLVETQPDQSLLLKEVRCNLHRKC
jgi:hypothetical protein